MGAGWRESISNTFNDINLKKKTTTNIPCFLLLQFQEKSDSNSLLVKLVLGTSGRGDCFRRLGHNHRAVRMRFLCTDICVPGALTAQVSPVKFSGPHSPPFANSKGLSKGEKGIWSPPSQPSAFYRPLPAGPKAESRIFAPFA